MRYDPLSAIQQKIIKIIGDGNVIGDHNIVNVIKQIQVDLKLTLSAGDLQQLLPAIKGLEVLERVDQSPACKWYYPSEEDTIGPIRGKGVIDNDRFYVADREGRIYCLCIKSGEEAEQWKKPRLSNSIEGGLALADLQQGQQVLLVPCCDGNLYLIDPSTGRIVNKYQADGSLESAPLVTQGCIYLGCTVRKDWGGVIALRLRDGSLLGRWNAPSRKGVRGTPAVIGRRLYFATLDWSGKTVFQSSVRQSGRARLIFQTEGMISASLVVDETRRRIYLACEDSFVYAIKFTGKEAWRRKLRHPTRCTGIIDNNRFYIGDEAGCLYALDLDRRGDLLWSRPLDTGEAITATPVVCNESVIFGSRDGQVYSVDSSTGKSLGEFTTEGKVIRSLSATEDGTVLVGCDEGSHGVLYALHWHLGEHSKAAQHLEAHQKWTQAATLWMEKGEPFNAVRCYQGSGRYKLAALVAEHYSLHKDAAVNYERSAAQTEKPYEQARLYWRAAENWAKLGRMPDARRCRKENARVRNAPFLILTPENRHYHVEAETDIVLQFRIENHGFSIARQIFVQVTGDVQGVCKGKVPGILEKDHSSPVQVRGVIPTTKGKLGGVAILNAHVCYDDKDGNPHQSVPIQLDIEVNAKLPR